MLWKNADTIIERTIGASIVYKIETTDYGVRLTFSGSISSEEMAAWLAESRQFLNTIDVPFCVFVDMREFIPIDEGAREYMITGQKLYLEKGMKRSAVIWNSPVTAYQFRGIAHETGISKNERYIDASADVNWEEIALDWLIKGTDPIGHVNIPFSARHQ